MSHVVECPSGLSFHARKLKGSEANLFTDRTLIRRGLLVDKLLDAAFDGAIEPGPYKVGQDGTPPWDRMLTGDRIVALIQVRIATYGPDLEFKVQCDDESCRKRFDVELNLDSDLVVKPLAEEDREAYEAGNKLTTDITVDGVQHVITFHLLTGKDESRMTKLSDRAPAQQVTMALAQRIDEISGVHKNDKVRWLEGLDLDVMTELVEKLDAHDCGVETDIECECTYCGNFMEVNLPLGGREFFLPKRKKTPSADRAQADE